MVNAEEQGNQAQIMSERDPYPISPKSTFDGRGCTLVRCMRIMNGNGMSFDGNSQGGDLGTLKQIARERTQEPLKNQLKGGEFRKSERKRCE